VAGHLTKPWAHSLIDARICCLDISSVLLMLVLLLIALRSICVPPARQAKVSFSLLGFGHMQGLWFYRRASGWQFLQPHFCLRSLLVFFGFKKYSLRAGSPDSGAFARFRRFPIFWLDTICGPNGGPAMIAWVLAFLGSPPPAKGYPDH